MLRITSKNTIQAVVHKATCTGHIIFLVLSPLSTVWRYSRNVSGFKCAGRDWFSQSLTWSLKIIKTWTRGLASIGTCSGSYFILWISVSLESYYSVLSLLALKNCSIHPGLLLLVLIMVQESNGYSRTLPLSVPFLVNHSVSKGLAKGNSFCD